MMYFDKKQILKSACIIVSKLIYQKIPKEDIGLFLPYYIVPNIHHTHKYKAFLITPDEIGIEKELKIWNTFENTGDNKNLIQQAKIEGRAENTAIYSYINKINLESSNIIDITFSKKNYLDIINSANTTEEYIDQEFKGVDRLYPVLISCKQKNGNCFLIISITYSRNCIDTFKTVRWLDEVRFIIDTNFWEILGKNLDGISIEDWKELREESIITLSDNFKPYHMIGGIDQNISDNTVKNIDDDDIEYYIDNDNYMYNDSVIKNKLSKSNIWKNFFNEYKFISISGEVFDWKSLNVRMLIGYGEYPSGNSKIGKDFTDVINSFFSFQNKNDNFIIINNIEPIHDYLWFNPVPLLSSLTPIFQKSSKFVVVFSSLDNDSIKGLLIKIYTYEFDRNDPKKIYNDHFPRSNNNNFNNLKEFNDKISYYNSAIVIYKALEKDFNQVTKFKYKIMQVKNKNLERLSTYKIKNNYIYMFDSFLSIFIPAKETYNDRFQKNVFEVNTNFQINSIFEEIKKNEKNTNS